MTDAQLREAFQSLAAADRDECTPEQLDRIWRAVTGELPPHERHEVVARLAESPAAAEAWRIADELWRASNGSEQTNTAVSAPAPARGRAWNRSWLALAALVVLGVTATLVTRFDTPGGNEFRAPGTEVVTSVIPADATLPRDAFALRWTPGPDGSRYAVRVTSADLTPLASVTDLDAPEFVVPPSALATVASGSPVLWQVQVRMADGTTASSETFVTRVD